MAAEDCQLVAQDEDLRVLGGGVHLVETEQLEDARDQPMEQAECHGRGASPDQSPLVELVIDFVDPSPSVRLEEVLAGRGVVALEVATT